MLSPFSTISDAPGSEEWGNKLRKRARYLVKAINQGYMELAEIIHTVWATPINGEKHNACVCVAWGYESYVQWGEEELGLHRRKIERLKAIWHHLNETLQGKLDEHIRKRIIALGWTKVRELIRVMDERNAEQWVEMAEQLNYDELCVAIRQALQDQEKHEQAKAVGVADDEEDDEWRGVDPPADLGRYKDLMIRVTPEQKANIELALGRASELVPTSKPLGRGAYLDLICTDFLATNDFKLKNDPEMPLRLLAKFERLLDKRLVVIDPQNWIIEYGMDSLQKVAEMAEVASGECYVADQS